MSVGGEGEMEVEMEGKREGKFSGSVSLKNTFHRRPLEKGKVINVFLL